jgi:glycosyltransferase involved in cell wall biosynthesis
VRVLVVAYAFPPVGGAGVQRMAKLVKYLPGHGVTPSVLTVRHASAPLVDASLAREVPPDLEILRAPTLEPDYSAKRLVWEAQAAQDNGKKKNGLRTSIGRLLGAGRRLLVPDPQVLWLPGAAHALTKRLLSRKDDAVLISGPPFSQFLLTFLAEPWLDTPVVLDYRDEWTTIASVFEMSGSARASAWLERALIKRASAVTVATEHFRRTLLERFPFLDPERVVTIENGYDPADFENVQGEPPRDHFVLTYAGTVYRLTNPQGFLDGLRLLHEREPELARSLKVRFAGRVVETVAPLFEGTEALGVETLGYVEHTQAVKLLAESHAAACILDEVPGVENMYPAKIFEIMRMGRRCLTLVPEGALSELVRRHEAGEVLHPRDSAGVAATLERWVREFRDGKFAVPHRVRDLERFDRSQQAGAFARVLRRAAGASAAGVGGSVGGGTDVPLRQREHVGNERRISTPVAHVVNAGANDV